jgi:hypothetical protein
MMGLWNLLVSLTKQIQHWEGEANRQRNAAEVARHDLLGHQIALRQLEQAYDEVKAGKGYRLANKLNIVFRKVPSVLKLIKAPVRGAWVAGKAVRTTARGAANTLRGPVRLTVPVRIGQNALSDRRAA